MVFLVLPTRAVARARKRRGRLLGRSGPVEVLTPEVIGSVVVV
jgi:hypothetical protein